MADQHSQQPSSPAERPAAFKAWIDQQLKTLCADALIVEPTLTPLRSDAGFRQYYRLNTQPSMLAVDAPPSHENSEQFIKLVRYLRPLGIGVPAVAAADTKRGFLLIEDFGDRLLQHELESSPDSAPVLYGEALFQLLALQQSPDAQHVLEPYDRQALADELALFSEWFITQLLQYRLDEEEQQRLQAVFTQLENSALEQPQVLVHRDYHSRNLLLRTSGRMGIVDFQDALFGPITYDVVSLLRDCYLRWPAEQVQQWALGYGNMAADAGLLPEVDEVRYLRWFDWMGLQRHLKVLGVFARLSLRDNKHHYLADLPLVIRYVLEVCQRYPELAEFAQWFEQHLLPLVQQQPWYQDYRRAGDLTA